ncbi:hypothetical protein PB2503_09039 [Parvularcula bermudensis HTCC2503]|uniref:Stringent starvation protein B n=1 Tax=Parvularcula bermudensis (strain ATCC BAA-594 / HTCC2503 / KCTC 12087) TaxID=314260 RepID=E0TCS2_PARBH|nr:ClpXP protease specificity-enhancing factor SspB [Parvularcula bermudensis]ADM09861.1 hypothetical protein PB2503_09039 [Parvularcula bermudensis HTCC2503]
MADDDSELDYTFLELAALRNVVRDVLSITETLGHPPGEHHFYIGFLTNAKGVEMSDTLREQYPERMVIVLQHQFEGLRVYADRFEVTLHFKGVPDRLIIPFDAIAEFADPSVNYSRQFPVAIEVLGETDTAAPTVQGSVEPFTPRGDKSRPAHRDDNDDDGPDDDGPSGPQSGSADIVSIDRFRKK